MEPQLIALLILLPFIFVFVYAGIQEYRRYKSQGRATYGLVYDEETGATHVTEIPEGEEGYNPDDFDPSAANSPEDADDPDAPRKDA